VEEMADYNLVGVIKVMPTDPEVNLDELEEKLKAVIPEKYGLAKVEREPIAFGLVALKFYILGRDE
jgi:elongation factor 1-beta